jgi:hypothetical protein
LEEAVKELAIISVGAAIVYLGIIAVIAWVW